MREPDQVIAILCSDLHLSAKPPRARRKESDWYAAMEKSLRQLSAVKERYQVPILCAGDIFDHWRAEPELLNFAINYLPEMYAIPGQHDLPLHNMELIKRSAYWTMVLVGRIHHVMHGNPVMVDGGVVVHAFPWGTRIEPREGDSKKKHVAICHEYFWTDVHCFPGAPAEREASRYKDLIKGYHAVAFGDNHKGFLTKINGTEVLNCGGFMRRTSDQVDYVPKIGLLCASGQILVHGMKTSHESFVTLEEEEEGMSKILRSDGMKELISGLSELGTKQFDFAQAIEYEMENKRVNHGVRRMILEALGRG